MNRVGKESTEEGSRPTLEAYPSFVFMHPYSYGCWIHGVRPVRLVDGWVAALARAGLGDGSVGFEGGEGAADLGLAEVEVVG